MDIRKPFIRFEVRPVEDRTRSLVEGRFVTRDEDYIILIPHGSEGKLSVERPFTEWLTDVEQNSGDLRASGAQSDTPLMAASRFPVEWLVQIKEGHKAWKAGREMPIDGTPLANWPVISPGSLANCQGLHIRTIEELAGADDETIKRLGMGAVTLQMRAKDWVRMNGSDIAKATADMEKLRSDNARLMERLAALEEKAAKSEET
jgi:hypothetical protein